MRRRKGYAPAYLSPLEPFEGDLSSGEFSASPDSPRRSAEAPSSLSQELMDEREEATQEIEWRYEVVGGRRHLIALVGDAEVASLSLGEELYAKEELVESEDLEEYLEARYSSVRLLKRRKEETKSEFFVRVLTHGENVDSLQLEFLKPLKSVEYQPGEYIELLAKNLLATRLGKAASKVLSRSRFRRNPGVVALSIPGEGFQENPDTDAWRHNWYHLDDIASGRHGNPDTVEWIRSPDLLTSWLDG